jgi:hypothetical protein
MEVGVVFMSKSSSESLMTSRISDLRPPALLFLDVGWDDDNNVASSFSS